MTHTCAEYDVFSQAKDREVCSMRFCGGKRVMSGLLLGAPPSEGTAVPSGCICIEFEQISGSTSSSITESAPVVLYDKRTRGKTMTGVIEAEDVRLACPEGW